jgi:hypothetical protein
LPETTNFSDDKWQYVAMNRGFSFQTLRYTGIHYALVQSLEGSDSQIQILAGQRPPLLIKAREQVPQWISKGRFLAKDESPVLLLRPVDRKI